MDHLNRTVEPFPLSERRQKLLAAIPIHNTTQPGDFFFKLALWFGNKSGEGESLGSGSTAGWCFKRKNQKKKLPKCRITFFCGRPMQGAEMSLSD